MSSEGLSEVERVIARQSDWAIRTSRPVRRDGKAFSNFEDCLFTPLDEVTQMQLKGGRGNEPYKLASLRSSTTLVLNLMHPWKLTPSPLAKAIGFPGTYTSMDFEQVFPTGISNPQLDVVIQGDADPIAIESKFVEIYDNDKNPPAMQDRYFTPGFWEGWPSSQSVAREIQADPYAFRWLNAAQLLKHSLGLSTRFGPSGFNLVYVWYEVPGDIALAHRRELERFAQAVGGEFRFSSLTYQEAFAKLAELPEPAPRYIEYLEGRYFSHD